MKLSKKWLNEFVEIECTPKEFCEAVTMTGSKVEGYEIEGAEISNIVVGRVLSIERHPDADKLVVCKVDVGDAELQIVTGASNLTVGDLVPVCKDNATLPGGKKIKKGKLRGVVSEGMMCSLGELGLTAHDFPYAIEDGIFVLREDCVPGDDIRSAIGLNDTVFEFEITSNRPDCLSVIGLAREVAVTYDKPLTLHTPAVREGEGDIHDRLSVNIENSALCSRYCARMIDNVRVKPSPRWMRERLRASGVRPINNIVDITNYVMLEYGQPMHAFDSRFVTGSTINIRTARKGESITTLDGEVRELADDMLIIADAEKPIGVAGVMGGEYSGIMDDTTSIIFESACFDGASVRTTARDLGMRTDASSRFEKGLDSANCIPALERACELVELLDAGDVVGGVIDCGVTRKERHRVKFEPNWINAFLGTDIPSQRMVDILKSLDCEFDGDDILVPTYRADLESKADIAEEVARIYGYGSIPSTELRGSGQGGLTPEQKFRAAVKNAMAASGLYEIMTYSFISPKSYDKILMPADSPLRSSVVISNPLGEDTGIMRTTALPSMLDTLSRNYNNRNLSASLFEIATEYIPVDGEELPNERKKLMIGMYGAECDFYRLKGVIEELLAAVSIDKFDVTANRSAPAYHPGRCADITSGGTLLGTFGEIHPTVLENYELGCRAYTAELDMQALISAANFDKQYTPLPKYPAVTRDIALVCDRAMPVQTLQRAIEKAGGKILESVTLFDVYTGAQIEDSKKSVAYNVVFRSSDRTLTDDESDNAIKRIMRSLEELGAVLRS